MSSFPEKKRKKITTTKKPSLKKKKKKEPVAVVVHPPTPQSTTTIPSLPDDLLLSCFARVSRLYYPTLSLVSKSFRSLIASPELYKTRSSLGHTENCLYVCLRFHPDPIPRWFTLCRKPNQTLTLTTNDHDTIKKKKKKPSGYVLAKIQTPHSGNHHLSKGLVTIGSEIYNIGGPNNDEPSSKVSIFDSRSNTWREGPSMLVKRSYPAANVVDGKIYVAGGCRDEGCKNAFKNCSRPLDWMEVFDPKTQTWELVSNPGLKICGCNISKSAGADGKVYLFGSCTGLSYEPRGGRWERLGWDMDYGWVWYSNSVIGNVLYLFNEGEFKWYDSKGRVWRVLKGVKGLPKIPRYIARLADYGGKMAVFWERVVAKKDKVILCAVIALERRSDEEIWGKVEWFDTVLTVSKECRIEYALAATV